MEAEAAKTLAMALAIGLGAFSCNSCYCLCGSDCYLRACYRAYYWFCYVIFFEGKPHVFLRKKSYFKI